MTAAREAIGLEPQSWAAHLLFGVAAASAGGHWRDSRAAFGRASMLAPPEAEIPFSRGLVLHSLEANRRARRANLDALRIDLQHEGALEGLAAISAACGRVAESFRFLRSATAAAPVRVSTLEYLDPLMTGALGWAVMASWGLLVVLVFTAYPAAWLVGAAVVLACLWWLHRTVLALPPNTAQVVLPAHDRERFVREVVTNLAGRERRRQRASTSCWRWRPWRRGWR